ncbi:MAG: carboxypeptidase regulatory-like domain-containing protein [Candidatus Diapherotrites archaeon]|nr:carboxypeptidase regulatory-like domain-containing protein [Candidatus Diapherotrites archaeon]
MITRNLCVLLFFTTLLLFVGCLEPQETDKNVQFLVYDTTPSNVLEGASITISNSSGVFTSLTTDTSGVVFLRLPPGEYRAEVSKEGYQGRQFKFTVSGNTFVTLDAPLERMKPCVENWSCSEWSLCINGTQTRSCIDSNHCNTTENKTIEEQSCTPPECQINSDCNDSNPCTTDSCVDGTCKHETITKCKSGDKCCPSGCTHDKDSDCLQLVRCNSTSDCDDGDSCTLDICSGNPRACSHVKVTACSDNDGCCPAGCTYKADDDCEPVDECQTDADCDDSIPCTKDTCSGAPKTCSHAMVTQCVDNDSCCPEGCSYLNDTDCPETDECSTDSDCDDGVNCTLDTCSGTPKACHHTHITTCQSGDGCCPEGCNYLNDTDCPNLDQCLTNADCDDNNVCTMDVCNGTPKMCYNLPITECRDNDGCCPSGCSYVTDNDCSQQEVTETLYVGDFAVVGGLPIYLQSVTRSYMPGVIGSATMLVGGKKLSLNDGDAFPGDENWKVKVTTGATGQCPSGMTCSNGYIDYITLYYDKTLQPSDKVTKIVGPNPNHYFELSYDGDEVSRGVWDSESVSLKAMNYGCLDKLTYTDGTYEKAYAVDMNSNDGLTTAFLADGNGGVSDGSNPLDLQEGDIFFVENTPVYINSIAMSTSPYNSKVTFTVGYGATDGKTSTKDVTGDGCTTSGGWVYCTPTILATTVGLNWTFNISQYSEPILHVLSGADNVLNTKYGSLTWQSDNHVLFSSMTFKDSYNQEFLVKRPSCMSTGLKVTDTSETMIYVDQSGTHPEYEYNKFHETAGAWIESVDDDTIKFVNPEHAPRTERVTLCKLESGSSGCEIKDLDWNYGITPSNKLVIDHDQGLVLSSFPYNGSDYDYSETVVAGDSTIPLYYEEGTDFHGVYFSDLKPQKYYYRLDFLDNFPIGLEAHSPELKFLGSDYTLTKVGSTEVDLVDGANLLLGVGSCQDVPYQGHTYNLCVISIGFNDETETGFASIRVIQ